MRRWWLPILLVLLMPALPALAGEAGAKPGLMDVDPASAIVAIAVFVVLLVVLGKFAWGPILKGLKEREDTIRKAVDEAKAASDRAQAVVQEYEARMARAAEEGKAILEEAKRDAQALKAQIEAAARSEAEAAKQRAVKEIEQARLAAWDTLVRDAAQLATEAASRIVHKSLDAAGHEKLVADVVGQVQASRAGRGD